MRQHGFLVIITASTRLGSRLDNPYVVGAVNVELRAASSQLGQHCLNVTEMFLDAGNWNVFPANSVIVCVSISLIVIVTSSCNGQVGI